MKFREITLKVFPDTRIGRVRVCYYIYGTCKIIRLIWQNYILGNYGVDVFLSTDDFGNG